MQCHFCGGPAKFHARTSDVEYYTLPDTFTFFHCETCDVLFLSPMPVDRLSEIYPTNYYSFDKAKTKSYAFRVKEWIDRLALKRLMRQFTGETVRVLDVGGGTGWLASVVKRADRRAETYVVDLDEHARAAAVAAGHQFFLGRVEDFKPEEKFDLVLALNLIEHVPRPDIVLHHLAGMLSPQGQLLIKTPNFRALDARIFRHHDWSGYHCPRHFVLFNRGSITRFIERAGMVVDRFAYTQGAPFWAGSVLLMLNRFGLVKLGPDNLLISHPLLPLLQAAGAVFDYARRPFWALSQMTVVARRRA